jgi:hypothetical protein
MQSQMCSCVRTSVRVRRVCVGARAERNKQSKKKKKKSRRATTATTTLSALHFTHRRYTAQPMANRETGCSLSVCVCVWVVQYCIKDEWVDEEAEEEVAAAAPAS